MHSCSFRRCPALSPNPCPTGPREHVCKLLGRYQEGQAELSGAACHSAAGPCKPSAWPLYRTLGQARPVSCRLNDTCIRPPQHAASATLPSTLPRTPHPPCGPLQPAAFLCCTANRKIRPPARQWNDPVYQHQRLPYSPLCFLLLPHDCFIPMHPHTFVVISALPHHPSMSCAPSAF